jgi:hypothetical protein
MVCFFGVMTLAQSAGEFCRMLKGSLTCQPRQYRATRHPEFTSRARQSDRHPQQITKERTSLQIEFMNESTSPLRCHKGSA